jgi:hypothetical protein
MLASTSGVRSSNLFGRANCEQTTNSSVRVLFTGNDSLQDVLASDNTDRLVIDLDGIDDGADVALAGVGIAVVELFGHQSCKGADFDRVDHRYRAALRTFFDIAATFGRGAVIDPASWCGSYEPRALMVVR